MRRTARVGLALLGVFWGLCGVRSPALAVLAEVGPTDPSNGFPAYYMDSRGLTLELCLSQADSATTAPPSPMCLTAEPNPAAPIAFPANFGDEAFWWTAGTILPIPASPDLAGGGSADLTLALEAAFLNGPVVPGDQVAFVPRGTPGPHRYTLGIHRAGRASPGGPTG